MRERVKEGERVKCYEGTFGCGLSGYETKTLQTVWKIVACKMTQPKAALLP